MGCVFSASQANSLESDTGDVRFICLERLSQVQPSQPSPNVISTPRRPGSAASTSSYSAFSTELTARKRVIYAHSDIISRRSEYFATMLSSSFSEVGTGPAPGERKVYTITVEEADFETIYWLLKWVYGNWLLFKEHDDPRAAVDGVGEGWSARWLNARGGEWDWKTFRKSNLSDGSITGTRDDARSVASADSETDKLVGGQDQSPVQSSTTPTASSVRAPPVVRTTSSSKTIPVPANPGNVSRQISTPPAVRYLNECIDSFDDSSTGSLYYKDHPRSNNSFQLQFPRFRSLCCFSAAASPFASNASNQYNRSASSPHTRTSTCVCTVDVSSGTPLRYAGSDCIGTRTYDVYNETSI